MNLSEQISALQDQLAAAQAQAQQNFASLNDANTRIEALTSELATATAGLSTANARADAAETTLATERESRTELVSKEVTAALGASGITPIRVEVTPNENKPGNNNLTGLDRAIAAHTAASTRN